MNNKDYVTELSEDLNQIYSHLGVEAFPNQQEEALKIIDGFDEKLKQLEKALELACDKLQKLDDYLTDIIESIENQYNESYCLPTFYYNSNYFINKAKEQLKDE
jgi:hypothetical protein